MEILESPNKCQEIAGYILVIKPGGKWVTQDGQTTTVFGNRGVWATVEEAEEVQNYISGGENGMAKKMPCD